MKSRKTQKVKFTCSLCGEEKEERKPRYTRVEHSRGKVKNYGICRPCIKITHQHKY